MRTLASKVVFDRPARALGSRDALFCSSGGQLRAEEAEIVRVESCSSLIMYFGQGRGQTDDPIQEIRLLVNLSIRHIDSAEILAKKKPSVQVPPLSPAGNADADM